MRVLSKNHSQNIERVLLINQTSQVSRFNPFMCMGKCKCGLPGLTPLVCTLILCGQDPASQGQLQLLLA